MNIDLKITKTQQEFLQSFLCERLTEKIENQNLLCEFKNDRASPDVIKRLKKTAWTEDAKGDIAYYIIKDTDENIVLFFALKCGVLFKSIDENAYNNCIKKYNKLEKQFGKKKLDLILNLIKALHSLNLTCPDMEFFMPLINVPYKKEIRNLEQKDKEKDKNKHLQRVYETYPGIELVLFYKNDLLTEKLKKRWEDEKIIHSMGTVFFWKYIVPVIKEIKRHIGCQYLFLFAADSSQDGTLINYYLSTLKFKDKDDFGTSKPSFDFLCKFMYQEIEDLDKNQESFFNNFNLGPDDV